MALCAHYCIHKIHRILTVANILRSQDSTELGPIDEVLTDVRIRANLLARHISEDAINNSFRDHNLQVRNDIVVVLPVRSKSKVWIVAKRFNSLEYSSADIGSHVAVSTSTSIQCRNLVVPALDIIDGVTLDDDIA